MIINIIFNTFQSYHRQNIAVDSFRHIKKLFPDKVRLHNLQFEDEKTIFDNPYPDIEPLFCLTDSRIQTKSQKKLPFIHEMFNSGLELEGDYTVICNSDVVLMPSLVQYILDKKPETVPCSRLDIQPVNSLQDILDQRVSMIRYNIGFDAFIFLNQWMVRNKSLFQTPYLLGNVSYDLVWAGYMKLFGDNTSIVNKFPAHVAHIFHGDSSIHTDTPERQWNCDQTKESPLNMMMHNIMTFYINDCLKQRKPDGTFLNMWKGEQEWENHFFGELTYNRNVV